MTIEEALKLTQKSLRELKLFPEQEDVSYMLKVNGALEKQIPYNTGNKFVGTCKCGKKVYPHMDYCDKCGQALKWRQ